MYNQIHGIITKAVFILFSQQSNFLLNCLSVWQQKFSQNERQQLNNVIPALIIAFKTQILGIKTNTRMLDLLTSTGI